MLCQNLQYTIEDEKHLSFRTLWRIERCWEKSRKIEVSSTIHRTNKYGIRAYIVFMTGKELLQAQTKWKWMHALWWMKSFFAMEFQRPSNVVRETNIKSVCTWKKLANENDNKKFTVRARTECIHICLLFIPNDRKTISMVCLGTNTQKRNKMHLTHMDMCIVCVRRCRSMPNGIFYAFSKIMAIFDFLLFIWFSSVWAAFKRRLANQLASFTLSLSVTERELYTTHRFKISQFAIHFHTWPLICN